MKKIQTVFKIDREANMATEEVNKLVRIINY